MARSANRPERAVTITNRSGARAVIAHITRDASGRAGAAAHVLAPGETATLGKPGETIQVSVKVMREGLYPAEGYRLPAVTLAPEKSYEVHVRHGIVVLQSKGAPSVACEAIPATQAEIDAFRRACEAEARRRPGPDPSDGG